MDLPQVMVLVIVNNGLFSKYWAVFWMQEIVGVEENMAIVDMDVFHKHLVLYQRRAGLPCVQILDLPLKNGVSFTPGWIRCVLWLCIIWRLVYSLVRAAGFSIYIYACVCVCLLQRFPSDY